MSCAGFRAACQATLLANPPALVPDATLYPGDHTLNPDLVDTFPAMRQAAVLIGIVAREEPTVIFTTRSAHLSDHAGQVAFPGGKIDQNDRGPLETAFREAHEEIGLDKRFITPLGFAWPYLSRSGFIIQPVVAEIAPDHHLTLDRREVDDAFEVPLSFLMNPHHHHRQSRIWQGAERHFYVIPYENRVIWGVSAGIIRALWQQVSM